MSEKQKLTIELVPSSAWYSNVRSHVTKHEWDRIRHIVYNKYDNKCAICGGVGHRHHVEAHEVFEYNTSSHTQKLIDIVALCPACHEVKHIGLAAKRGRLEKAINHLATVNKWTRLRAAAYVGKSFEAWDTLNRVPKWTPDLGYLESLKP